MPSSSKRTEPQQKVSNTGLERSGTLNRSSGGPNDDDFALSMDETDFGLSESNFSHKFA